MGPSYKAFDPAKHVLGTLCKRGHDYRGTRQSLRRINGGDCAECATARVAVWRANHPEENRAWAVAYRAANRDKQRAQHAAWEAANPDKVRAYGAAHYAKNREKKLARDAAWRARYRDLDRARRSAQYAKNRERLCAQHAAWEAANPMQRRARNRLRRDRKAAAPVLQHITAAQSRQRKKDFGAACAFCGATKSLHLDHFLPLSAGNALTLGNAIPACQRCNCSKNASDPHDWYNRQPFFSQKRWDRILKVLGKHNQHHGQMTLV